MRSEEELGDLPRIWSILVVPDRGRDAVYQFHLRSDHLVLLRRVSFVALFLLTLFSIFLLSSLPLITHHEDLVEQNLALREELAAMEAELEQAARGLQRLHWVDTQFQAMQAGRGPLDDEEWSLRSTERELPSLEGYGLFPGGLSDLLERSEQVAARLVRDIDTWKAQQAALPQIWPVPGPVTSRFGHRKSPFSGKRSLHSGLDLHGLRGAPVKVVAPGTVTRAGYTRGYGRIVEVDHGFGIKTVYAHNHRLYVSKGDRVHTGELIATVGSTGNSTGPHLHFELWLNGIRVDPEPYLPEQP